MKKIAGVLFGILIAICFLLFGVIALCAVDRTLSKDIANVLYGGNPPAFVQEFFSKEEADDEGEKAQSDSSETDLKEADLGDTSNENGLEEVTGGGMDIPVDIASQNSANESGGSGNYILGYRINPTVRNGSSQSLSDSGYGHIPEQNGTGGTSQSTNENFNNPDVVPDGITGVGGYEPITAQSAELGDDAIKAKYDQLGTGPTGEELTFNAATYPYYQMLKMPEQKLYRQIYANLCTLSPGFKPATSVTTESAQKAFEAVFGDHPELFWVDPTYSVVYEPGGDCVGFDLSYNDTADNLEQATSDFDAVVAEIVQGASALPSDYEKEKFVHDILLAGCDYDVAAENNQSAYGALIEGRCVCAGYARAFQYLMQRMGIPCYYCSGYAGLPHAWNLVVLDDGLYNVDLTWDDTGTDSHAFFNVSDEDIAAHHTRQNLSTQLPECNGEKYKSAQ